MPKSSRLARLRKFKPKRRGSKTFYEEFSKEDKQEWDDMLQAVRNGEIDRSNLTALSKELIKVFNIPRGHKSVMLYLQGQLDEST